MESFFRIVSYVDYYENGTRVKNAGFLRWRIREQEHRIELQVKDAEVTGRFFIIEEKTGKKLGDILLDKGTGTYRETFQGQFLGREKLCYEDIRTFKILLEEGRYLRIVMELPRLDWGGEKEQKTEIEEIPALPVKETEPKESCVKESKPEPSPAQDAVEKQPQPQAARPLQEDKWKQLCNNYPTVHPFHSGKAFVSLTPKDFVVLREEYQKLVHNSFLLHGYYNYQHMILGKLEEEEESPYYLGVPGVYYERERQAAQMFGFVGFEGVEDPVQNGSYGYYMIPVEI